MAGRSLAGLVAEARERYVRPEEIVAWLLKECGNDWYEAEARQAGHWLGWAADEAVRLTGAGISFRPWNNPVPWEDLIPTECGAALDDVKACPAWAAFAEVCELADRVDSFLATLEGGPGAAVARGCRQDLDGLAVLADWCEENGRPAAAAEARHLHALVRRALG